MAIIIGMFSMLLTILVWIFSFLFKNFSICRRRLEINLSFLVFSTLNIIRVFFLYECCAFVGVGHLLVRSLSHFEFFPCSDDDVIRLLHLSTGFIPEPTGQDQDFAKSSEFCSDPSTR